MTHGSLFSGIGGFDLAAEWMGWENIFHCEIAEFPRQILKYHFPNSICYEDIKKTDFTKHRGEIDIISGGFPCQPYSSAGNRRGKEDDRHLWPEMLRVIREIQPRFVLGENVAGLLSWNDGMVFDEIITDLENEGYETQAFLIPACAKNAPHRRDRIWFVAHSKSERTWEQSSKDKRWEDRRFNNNGETRNVTNCFDYRLEECFNGESEKYFYEESGEQKFKSISKCIKSIKTISTRDEITNTFNQRFKSKTKNWKDFPTQSPICLRNDGISDRLDGIAFSKWRNESIKGYGNAVVPQVVYQIFKAIEQSIAE